MTLALVFAIASNPSIFALGACIAFLAAIAFGCTLIPEGKHSATWLGAVAPESKEEIVLQGQPLVLLGVDVAQDYPQMLVFRTRLTRIWLLLLASLIGAVALWWLVNRGHTFGLQQAYFMRLAAAPAVYLAYKWVRERWVLKKQNPVLGLLSAVSGEQLHYEFFVDGERHGDIAEYCVSYTGPLIVVFVDRKNPARHEPSFNLLFHKLEIMERIHWPESRLAETGA